MLSKQTLKNAIFTRMPSKFLINNKTFKLNFQFLAAIKPPRGSFKEEIRRQIIFEFQKRWIHDHSREREVFDMYLSEIKRDRRSFLEACLALISGN